MNKKLLASVGRRVISAASVLALTVSIIASGTGLAAAANAPTMAEMVKVIAALEARVTALEGQLQTRPTNAGLQAQATTNTPQPMLVALADPAPAPMSLGHATQDPRPEYAEDGWSGLYWGAAFGYGATSSSSRYRNVDSYRYQDSSESTSTLDGTSLSSMNAYQYATESDTVRTGASNGAGRMDGALADLYLGVNAHLTPRVIVGAQVEGTMSELTFSSTINKNKSSFTSTTTNTSQDSNGSTNNSYVSQTKKTGNSTDVYEDVAEFQVDWMVSVIGRAGVLATPSTFVYGLAGWTYGHFDVEQFPYASGLGTVQEFDANGPTVGAGLEQKLSPKWSLRAEYRYTDFGTKNVSARENTSYARSNAGPSSQSSVNSGMSTAYSGSESDSSNQGGTYRATGSFDNDMHVGRVGVTRYFSWGDMN